MSDSGKTVEIIKKIAKKVQTSPVQVAQVVSLKPFALKFQGLEISKKNGDTIYVNHLLLDENIELDLASMDEAQNINPALWKADNTPTPTVEISGTQKQFLTDLYAWIKSVHQRYILSVGDFVAIQRLGNNTYLILEKVSKIE